MKTLEQVKEEYAKIIGYDSWQDLLNDDDFELSEIYDHHDQVAVELCQQNMKIYANKKLNKASEIIATHPAYFSISEGYEYDKKAILSLKDEL